MKGPIPDHWSSILLETRKETRLTRTELSRRSGVGISTIENYERKKILEPSIYKMEALLAAMNYDLDAIKTSGEGAGHKDRGS